MNNKLLFNSGKVKQVYQVSDLVKFVRELEEETKNAIYFRGHANIRWKLVPSIARPSDFSWAGIPLKFEDPKRQEMDLLHRFRRHTYEERGRLLNEWEALFLARHHDLPVRLLDWTTNPLVALYFACVHEKKAEEDGIIWWFERKQRGDDVDVFSVCQKPFEINGIRLIYPFYPTIKMTVQSGIFTIHQWPWEDLRYVSRTYYAEDCDIDQGACWIVPKQQKANLLKELNRLGINERTLFPGLAGLAKGLIQEEIFRIWKA